MNEIRVTDRVRDFLEAVGPEDRVERIDLSRHGRLTALLSRPDSLLGVRLRSRKTITFAPTEDPRLFAHRSLGEIARAAVVDVDDRPSCVGYRPMKRVVFSGRRDGEPLFMKIRKRAHDRFSALDDHRVWPRRIARHEVDAISIELWRPAGTRSLKELIDARDSETDRALRATSVAMARLAVTKGRLPRRSTDDLVEETMRQLEKERNVFGESADASDVRRVLDGLHESGVADAPVVVSHGDLHDGQVFVDESGTARFIDADALRQGPLEWDAANLAAHLDLAEVRSEPGIPISAKADAFLGFYLRALTASTRRRFSADRFRAFRALALLRLSGVYGCRPPWRSLSAPLRRMAADLVTRALLLLILFVAAMAGAAEASEIGRLRDGLWLEVEGEHRPGKRFKAEKIEIKDPSVGRRPEVKGRIDELDLEARRISVVGLEIEVAHDLSRFSVGDPVEASGMRRLRGDRWRATDVRRLDRFKDDDGEVEGFVSSVRHSDSGVRFEVNGVRIRTASDVEFIVDDAARHLLVPDLGVGGAKRRRSDDDWQPRGASFIHPNLSFGGRVTAKVLDAREFDLDVDEKSNLTESGISARLYGRWRPSPWVEAYAEVRGEGREALRTELDSPFAERNQTEFRSGPTYLFYRPEALPNVAAQLGRVDLEDDREWFYDQNLDGLRLLAANDLIYAEAGAYRTNVNPTNETKDEKYVVLSAESRLSSTVKPAIFYLNRRDRREPENKRHWIGGRLPIKTRHLRVWSDWVVARGDYRGKVLRTWAADSGLLIRWKQPFRASLYGGYAFGSGDDDRASGIDREFRDTGLSDNTGVMDGLKSFDYYGELTDPELSNVRIWTAGVGFYPVSWISVDVILHGYRQVNFRDRFRSEVPIRPEGLDKNLGREIDLFIGVRGSLPVDLEIGYSRFEPGLAFASRQMAEQFQVQVEWRR